MLIRSFTTWCKFNTNFRIDKISEILKLPNDIISINKLDKRLFNDNYFEIFFDFHQLVLMKMCYYCPIWL